MSQSLPLPQEIQANSLPLDSLADGKTANDVLTWNGTEWISASSSSSTVAGTTNQINANTVGSTTTISLSNTLIVPDTLSVTNNTTLNGKSFNKEVISSSTALSTTLDSLINTVNGPLSCTLATGLPYQTKTVGLNTQRSNTATISCSTGGTFELTPADPVRNLYYDASSGSWQIEGGVSQTTPVPLSFYVTQQQGTKLVGTGTTVITSQGTSCAISADGNTLAVGGSRICVFIRSGTTWTQQGDPLFGTGNTGGSNQGASISLSADGNTLAIGGNSDNSSNGATWIFTRSGTTWTQQGTKLVGTGNTGAAQQGASCALSADGNTLAVGGNLDNSEVGAVWIFTRNAGVWTQQGTKLFGTGYTFIPSQGRSCALSANGNVLAIGGEGDNISVGAMWIFSRSGTVWTQQGTKLVGTGTTGSQSAQGRSCSLSASGDTLAVGGRVDNADTGAVWIFTRTGTSWSQQGDKLVGTGNTGSSLQGNSCCLSADGNTVAIGAQGDNSNIGATWIFIRSNTIWSQKGNKLVGTGNVGTSRQGVSCALSASSNVLAVGSTTDNTNIGATWIFI